MELWESEIVSLRESGLSWRTLAGEIRARYPELAAGNDDLQLRSKARNAWKKAQRHRRGLKTALPGPREPLPAPRAASAPQDSALMDALIKGADLQGLADELGISARVAEAMVQDVRDQGFVVQERDGIYRLARIIPPAENRVPSSWVGEKVIRFGLMGDTQLGCMDTQITLLHKLYDFYEAEGITSVFHTGDMTDGEKMRPGHEYELYVHGADAQAVHVAKVYPRRDGITTRFITGNHDYSFVKSIGMDIGRQVAALREDMDYLGYMTAYVELTPRCVMELHHPQDGTCYAQSYKIQKIIEAMSGGEKPNILAVGHYHKQEYFFYRNVHALQTACLCGQTSWMRGKGISAAMGGWLVELHVDDEGTITRIKPEFMPFYKAIREDYRNWA